MDSTTVTTAATASTATATTAPTTTPVTFTSCSETFESSSCQQAQSVRLAILEDREFRVSDFLTISESESGIQTSSTPQECQECPEWCMCYSCFQIPSSALQGYDPDAGLDGLDASGLDADIPVASTPLVSSS